jgi:DNA-binding MarR family transcriptional regulator
MERVMQVYNRAKNYAMKKVDLSGPELSLLAEAVRHPGATLQFLAEKLSLTLNAASDVVASLVEKGMVSEKGPKGGGKKKVRVSVTKKGRVTKLHASELAWMAFARALGGAASVAIAVAGLINTLSSILDRWRPVTVPELPPDPPAPRKRTKKRKAKAKKKARA